MKLQNVKTNNQKKNKTTKVIINMENKIYLHRQIVRNYNYYDVEEFSIDNFFYDHVNHKGLSFLLKY